MTAMWLGFARPRAALSARAAIDLGVRHAYDAPFAHAVSRMTYCVGITVDAGMVFASDSRTNAGADQISTYRKMHTFLGDGERFFVLLTAGNLATSQAVVSRLRRDLETNASSSLKTMRHMSEAAEHIGHLGAEQVTKHSSVSNEDFRPEATFIFGGQIKGQPARLFLIYPEGNYIRASNRTPYVQAGELKYGKPILDRIISQELPLETCARCALVSMDSTMRSNATVGPPIEIMSYSMNSQRAGQHWVLEEGDPYLRELSVGWEDSLKRAFGELPSLPAPTKGTVRLVDR